MLRARDGHEVVRLRPDHCDDRPVQRAKRYESFRDRNELLIAVFDACLLEMDQAMFAALAAAPADLLERGRVAPAR